MRKLVTSSEAASILGLSLQGIHYRIKKGQLESIKQDGKIFVYLDKNIKQNKQPNMVVKNIKQETAPDERFVSLTLKSKDEQIILLKKTLKYMKKQHEKEIARLSISQNKIIDVFQSEVDLLKSAFTEMKTIYKIEHEKTTSDKKFVQKEVNDINNKQKDNPVQKLGKLDLVNFISKKRKEKYITIEEFTILLKKHNITELNIKRLLINKLKSDDKRFFYDKKSKNIKIINSDFLDILEDEVG